MQLTAPYLPSQNGIAECMNRTLVELARAMIRAQKMPEFLWEHTIEHAPHHSPTFVPYHSALKMLR